MTEAANDAVKWVKLEKLPVDMRMPEWLQPYKNEWKSATALQSIMNIGDKSAQTFIATVKDRIKSVQRPHHGNGKGFATYYLVKQVWACARAHGLPIEPAIDTKPLEKQIGLLQQQVWHLKAKVAMQPEPVVMPKNAHMKMLLLSTEAKPLSGVYFLIHDGEVSYVGQSKNVLARMSGHTEKEFDAVRMIHIENPEQRMLVERQFIEAFQPRDNVNGILLVESVGRANRQQGMQQ